MSVNFKFRMKKKQNNEQTALFLNFAHIPIQINQALKLHLNMTSNTIFHLKYSLPYIL